MIYDLIYWDLPFGRRKEPDIRGGRRLKKKSIREGVNRKTERKITNGISGKVIVASVPQPLVPLSHCQPAN